MLTRNIPQSINDVKILEENGNKLVVQIDNVTIPYMKVLRDSMYDRVPTMAIDKIKIYNNTSVIPFELISDRLSLIPIKANADNFDDFKGEFNQNTSLIFTVDKTGPGQYQLLTHPYSNILFSSDVKWLPFEDQEYEDVNKLLNIAHEPDANQRVRFANDPPKLYSDRFIILLLRPNENIKLTAYAIKGTGEHHTKFSPVSRVFYEKVDDSEDIKIMGTSLDPISLKAPEPTYVQNDALMTYLDMRVANKTITVNEESMIHKPTDFILTINSKGHMSPKQILDKAIKITVSYMDLPLSKREKYIRIPGYTY